MTDLTKTFHNAGLTNFDPSKTAMKQAKTTAVAAVARKIKDWPTLESAVEAKIEDQREFVRWWRESVTNAHEGAFAEAELATGISHQQVSRWAKGLKDPAVYREALYGRAYAVAMGVVRTKKAPEDEDEDEAIDEPADDNLDSSWLDNFAQMSKYSDALIKGWSSLSLADEEKEYVISLAEKAAGEWMSIADKIRRHL
jgi:hypothetical protein